MKKNPYATQAVDSLAIEVNSASPHKLILMLFDGALEAMVKAKEAIKEDSLGLKIKMISRAMAIVDDGLRSSLNKEAGGDLAQRLDELYEYISTILLQANLLNDIEKLDEAHHLLADIRDAWAQITPKTVNPSDKAPDETKESYGNV